MDTNIKRGSRQKKRANIKAAPGIGTRVKPGWRLVKIEAGRYQATIGMGTGGKKLGSRIRTKQGQISSYLRDGH